MAAARGTRGGARRKKASGSGASRAAVPADFASPVAGTQTILASFDRIGGNLTPARVSTILRNADDGYPSSLVDLTHECRQKDGHFQSILETRELALTGLQWGMQPPEDADEREQEAAKACGKALLKCRTFPAMLAHHVGEGLLFAHATSEVVWKLGTFEDDPDLRGLLIPDYFDNISCRRFGFRRSDSKLLFDPNGHGDVDNYGVDLLEEYPRGKFVRTIRRINGDVLIREGLCRVLVWASLFRNWALRDWLMLAELAWKPLRHAKFNKDRVTAADITAIQGILERLTTLGWAAYPNSVDLNIEFPRQTGSGSQPQHQTLREHLGMEMSKAVLGGTLLAESGSRGARSLGEVHERRLMDRRDADAAELMAVIQTFLVEPFYRMNYGEAVRPAKFFFHTEDAVDTLKLAQTLKALVDAGHNEIPIAWVNDQMGIPAVSADEDGETEPCLGRPIGEGPANDNDEGNGEQESNDGDESDSGDDGED